MLQHEPFGAYVPPLFRPPATKEDFLLQNASSKQHKHMNKMGLTKAQLLEERKDKQRWDFLNRPETPRALVLTFYELEDNAKHKHKGLRTDEAYLIFLFHKLKHQAKISNLKGGIFMH